ncbi:hypothetical protein [Mycoplasmopsis canis]|nr:hypothetical protein [Mycoplasmopsis canis]
MTKDVKFKNFRVILLSSIAVIFVFYMISYTIMLGLESTYLSRKFYDYYSLTLGGFGLILFIVGFISNDIGYKITQTVSTARKLVPIAEDNLIHEAFSEKNSKNEYKKAIIFVAVFTLFSMITLSWLHYWSQKKKEMIIFDAVINMSCIALLIEDAMTFIVAFVLEKMKKISKIPFWEKINISTKYFMSNIFSSNIFYPKYFWWKNRLMPQYSRF